MNEKGFVLIEFVIALPLIIMLLYGLSQSTLMIFTTARSQAADYVLEVEAQDTLTRITNDLRTASTVTRDRISDLPNCEILIIKNHAIKQATEKIIDVTETRVYNVHRPASHPAAVYAQRQTRTYTSPITGGNFFGDTEVTRLEYSKLDDKVLRIELEMRSVVTNQRVKLSTAVFMPACDMKGF